MNLAIAPYLFTLYLSVSVCWFLAFYAWRRRQNTPATVAFAAVMLAAGLWAFGYGMELLTPAFAGKLFWFNFKQIGASALAPCLLLFSLRFTRQGVQFPRLLFAALVVEPIGSQLVFWTNSLHGWAGVPRLVSENLPFPVLYFDYGPWFWFSIFVGYLLFWVSAMVLLAQLPQANATYRKQLYLLLLGMLLPWFSGVLSLFGVGNLEMFDMTTFLFPISGVLMIWGLLRYRFLGLMPVAYSAVFSSIRDGIIIVDENLCITELNPAAQLLLGHKEQNLIGQPISSISPMLNQSLLAKTHTEQEETAEFYYEQAGQYRYLEVHGDTLLKNTVRIPGFVFILYDVTDRKLAEKMRQLSEDRYRTIFETDSAATIILEEDMTISLANERFATLSGFARHEIEGKMKWPRFVHAEDLPRLQTYHNARRQTDGKVVPNEYEFRLINRHGEIKNVFASVAMVPDSTISIASLLDITDRKLAEQLLEQRATDLETAVRSEQERSAIILQSVNDAIAVSTLNFTVAYVNRAFTELAGYTLEDVLGVPVTFILNGRLPQPLWDSLQLALERRTVWEGEVQLKRKNGTVYDAAVLVAPMYDGNGQLVGYVSSHRNITQTKQLIESRRRFITNVSHELRTPVTNIKLYTDLLHRRMDSPRREHYFSTLNEQIERLENIIQSTIDIIALEDTSAQLQRESIYWGTLCEQLQIRLQPQAEEKKITLRFEPGLAQLPTILGNPQRISQAIYELIHNAIKFSRSKGTVTVCGKVQINEGTQWVTLAVTDDGANIAEDEQARIFDRFYRGKQVEAGHIPGTGLGLSVVKLVTEAHNGRITLSSSPNQGNTFTLWFPLD